MKKLLVRPLYYPDRAHQLLGQDRLVHGEGQVGTQGAAEAALDAEASSLRACKASGLDLNRTASAAQKIIVSTTKRCWEDKSVNVHAML